MGSDIDGESAFHQSGDPVAMSADGSRVAIGSWRNGGNGYLAGHVRVYDWNGTSWVQVGADIDGEAAGDGTGTSVAVSADGSRVAIGAVDNDGTGRNAGHVRVYELQVGASRQGLIDQLSSKFGDQFTIPQATQAVDSLNVNWNAEAVEAAQSYVDILSFSCQGLIDQLSSKFGDQFTIPQATYGASQTGIC